MRLFIPLLALASGLSLGAVVQLAKAPAASAEATTGQSGRFVPYVGRLYDSRTANTPLVANTARGINVAGVAGIPSAGVSAVAINITVLGYTTPGFLTAEPQGAAGTPTTSSVNYGVGTGSGATTNSAVVAVTQVSGQIQVTASTVAHVILDVQGYYTYAVGGAVAPGGYVPVTQTRIADTRGGLSPNVVSPVSAIATNSAATVSIPSSLVPRGSSSIFANLTVISHSASDLNFLTPYATGSPLPTTSLNIIPNAVSAFGVAIDINDSTGQFTIASGGAGSALDVIVDIEGYYTAGAASAGFTPAAARVIDTRSPARPVASNSTATIQVGGVAGVPVSGSIIRVVAANITVIDTTGSVGWLVAYADDQSQPSTSDLNFATAANAPLVRSNLENVQLGADGGIKVYNSGATAVDVIVDIEGYYYDSSYLAAPVITSSYYQSAQPLISPTDETGSDFSWGLNANASTVTYTEDGGPATTVPATQTGVAWYPTGVGSHTLSVSQTLSYGAVSGPRTFTFQAAAPTAPPVPTFQATHLDGPQGVTLSGVVDAGGSDQALTEFYLRDSSGHPIGSTPYVTRTVANGERGGVLIATTDITTGGTYSWTQDACIAGVCSAQSAPQTFVAPSPVLAPTVATTTVALPASALTSFSAQTSATSCGGAPCARTADSLLRMGAQGTTNWESYLTVDLSTLPAGAIISKATLTLGAMTISGADGAPMSIDAFSMETMPAAGATGDVLALAAAASPLASAPVAASAFDLTQITQGWFAGDHPNAGIALAATLAAGSLGVTAPGATAASSAPTFNVTYSNPVAPSAPQTLTAAAGDGGVVAAWAAPVVQGTNKGIDHYTVSVQSSDGLTTLASSTTTALTARLTGLTDGAAYSLVVTATNTAGTGSGATVGFSPVGVSGGAQTWVDSATAYVNAVTKLTAGTATAAAEALAGVPNPQRLITRLSSDAIPLASVRQGLLLDQSTIPTAGMATISNAVVTPNADGSIGVWETASTPLSDSSGSSTALQDLSVTFSPQGVLQAVTSAQATLGRAPADISDTTSSLIPADLQGYATLPGTVPTGSNPAFPETVQPQYKHTINSGGAAAWARTHWNDPHYEVPNNCTAWVSRALHEGGGMAYNYNGHASFTVWGSGAVHDDNAWFDGYATPVIARPWNAWTASYVNASSLMTFLSRNPGKFVQYFSQVQPGDVIFYAWNTSKSGVGPKTIDHAGMVNSYYDSVKKDFTTSQSDTNYQSIWLSTSIKHIVDNTAGHQHPDIYIYRPYGSAK